MIRQGSSNESCSLSAVNLSDSPIAIYLSRLSRELGGFLMAKDAHRLL